MGLRDYESVFKAAADPTRVRILKILEGGEMCVCQVIAILSLGQSTVSKHLFLLRAAGLIKDRRDRKWVHYSLDRGSDSPYAARMLRNLRSWLNDDPVIAKDRKRAAMARAIGPMAICERKMTLTGRTASGGKAMSARPGDWRTEAAELRAMQPRHILFLCVANSARSQMAEGIARSLAPQGVKVSSAGSSPASVHPKAIQVLKEIGIDISGHRSKGLDSIDAGSVDAVITLCAEEICPVFLGKAVRVHWGLPDPAARRRHGGNPPERVPDRPGRTPPPPEGPLRSRGGT